MTIYTHPSEAWMGHPFHTRDEEGVTNGAPDLWIQTCCHPRIGNREQSRSAAAGRGLVEVGENGGSSLGGGEVGG